MATVASDAGRVYAAMKHGEVRPNQKTWSDPTTKMIFQVLVFDSCTFLLETVLEGRREPVWQVFDIFSSSVAICFKIVFDIFLCGGDSLKKVFQ